MELLERDGILQSLGALVTQAGGGDGRIALIRGEAGIGKTSVARALADSVAGSAHVLWGSCDDLMAPRPFGPVWDMAYAEPDLFEALNVANHTLVQHVFMDLFSRSLRPTVAVSVSVIVFATGPQAVVSPGDSNLTSTSPGAVASDDGSVDCGDQTHWHGSYKHEKRVVGGGGPGTVYEWHTVRPTGVEWKSAETICP